jgi:hypothetical protein
MNQSQITLEDFLPALEALLETETEYCLVGGLAVGVWAEVFLTPIEKTRFELPIRSKDIDIRAAKADAMMFLWKSLGSVRALKHRDLLELVF